MPNTLFSMLDGNRGVAYQVLFSKITGDTASGLFLGELAYWYLPDKHGRSKLRVTCDNRLWLAQHRAWWMDKLGITLDQYKRIVPLLKRMGLIETRRILFKRKVTPIIWLNEDRLCELIGRTLTNEHDPSKYRSIGGKATNLIGGKGPNGLVGKTPIYKHHLQTPLTTPPSGGASRSPEQQQAEPTEKRPREVKEGERENSEPEYAQEEFDVSAALERIAGMKAEDVLGRFGRDATGARQNDVQGPASPPAGSGVAGRGVSALDVLWRREVAGVTGGYVKALTAKERGQLKQLAKALADTPYPSPEVLMYAVRNWTRFTRRAQDNEGLATAPAQPHVGFLLAHHAAAVQLMTARPKGRGDTGLVVQSAPAPAKVPTTDHTCDSDPPMTFQEAMDLVQQAKQPK